MKRRNFLQRVTAALGIAAVEPLLPDQTVLADSPEPDFRDLVWTTADGRRVKVRDMEDNHVINIIWFLHRRMTTGGFPGDRTLLENFCDEAQRRKLPWRGPVPYRYPDSAPDDVRRYEIPAYPRGG